MWWSVNESPLLIISQIGLYFKVFANSRHGQEPFTTWVRGTRGQNGSSGSGDGSGGEGSDAGAAILPDRDKPGPPHRRPQVAGVGAGDTPVPRRITDPDVDRGFQGQC